MPSPCTVTATLQTVADAALQGNAYVRFILRNFAGFVPRVDGVSVITEFQLDVFPNGSGQISTTLWGNDNIDPAGTFYEVQWWNSGRITSRGNFNIIGTTFDLDSAAQINPPPPVPQTYITPLQLQTNSVANGSQTKLNLTSDGTITLTDNGSGTVTLKVPALAGGSFIDGDGLVFSDSPDNTLVNSFTAWDWEIQASGNMLPNIYRLGPYAGNVGTAEMTTPGVAGSAARTIDTALPTSTLYGTGTSVGIAPVGFAYNPVVSVPFNQHRRVNCPIKLGQVAGRIYFGIQNAVNSISLETDTPNIIFMGFRWSQTTDGANWQAITSLSNTAITLVDTGVAVDTNYHVFDIVYLGTSVKFYIDRVLVATINTNVPPSTTTPANPVLSLDDKGAHVNQTVNFYRMRGSMPRQYK